MKTYIPLILFLFLGISVIPSCTSKTETITPVKSNITESIYAAGIVKSENQYEVFSLINGKIETVFVNAGDTVSKGTPLFQLVNTGAKLSTDNALASAFANDYKRNQAKLADAKNAIDLAKKKLTNDSLLHVRQQQLWQQNIGSKVEMEQKEFNYENAKMNLKKAKIALEDVDRQLKLASDQSKNNLKISQSFEKDLLIRSEIDGLVYRLMAKQGEPATALSPLAVVGEKSFLIEFNVDELDIVRIREGQKVLISMDSYKDQVFEAKVSFIHPMMDERTGTFRVEALFTKAPEVLYPNLSLEVNIIVSEKKNVLTIPASYLINDSQVMLADGSVKDVQIGLKDYSTVEILSGIDENTKIKIP